jgi:PAS domain S-box-containing protein
MVKQSASGNPKKRESIKPVIEAFLVAVPYILIGCLWIFLTDLLLNLATTHHDIIVISNIKGWLYVSVTAVLPWILVYKRIKQVKKSQAELEDSETRFRLLVESAPDAVFVQVDYRFAYVNAKAVALYGAKSENDLLGQPVLGFAVDELRTLVMDRARQINEKKIVQPLSEEVIRRLDGGKLDVEVSAVPIRFNGKDGALIFMRDITERKRNERNRLRMEIQLREKHRMESIGTLASGIAHEINNPISGIINYAQPISEHSAADETLKEYSGEIMREGLRVAETVKNLLDFSQHNRQSRALTPVRKIVEPTVSVIEPVLRHDQIGLKVSIADHLPPLTCSAQQIRQVLMNLLTNARDALNVRYSGYDENKKIIVSASAIERDETQWVRFVVEDSGPGMSDSQLSRIFDPFYTTGARSAHSGLGLSICLGIVREHRGDIRFETQLGAYTRAIVELPAEEGALV